MKLAIMQPYLFPYIGYYQLIAAADHFIVLDDVTFRKQGWINRNRILAGDGAAMFTVPLRAAGSHVRIADLKISDSEYPRWRRKFLQTARITYQHAPHFSDVMPLVEEVFPERPVLIRDVAAQSLQLVMDYLGHPFPHSLSSDYAKPDAVRGAERVVFLCRQLRATAYYNAPGGTELYDRDAFMREGVELRFVVPRKVEYPQFRSPFVPWLSMLDVLMFNGREAVRTMLREYDLA